ncbi:GntR family transcriptional regulator [Alsobacter sp. SYSU M60028]|uniref:GntR family transcriptional regulator n=1 Tax=Alsobacter ponti TaxID=2962936 RepID=A0ABT1LBK2_9HYPH|nr:GntR family transcriptional regulator [Alsobacter ponti]MCP8938862.1 GntR family transcriptional regulator [Alsobacter ponti]
MSTAARARLDPVDPSLLRGLRDHVHEALRRAIVSGEIPSGAALNERQLAEELGVSTTPIKEALRRLENEGLAVTEPRRGTRVTFDARQAEEMALARAALEGMIARLAAQRVDDAALAAIQATVEQMRAATAEGDVPRLIALNEQFHDAIHDASGCRYLHRLIEGQRVYDHTARSIILGDAEERGRAFAEHAAIFEALARRDPDAAETAMRDHVVRSGRHHVKAAFDRRKEQAS